MCNRRTVLTGIAATVAAPVVTSAAETKSSSLFVGDDSPTAALARAEHAVQVLRTEYAGKRWLADADSCERTLNYFRRVAAAGTWPEDSSPDEVFASDFLYRHGISSDWIFRGDPLAFIIDAANRSKGAASLSDPDPILAAMEKHLAAVTNHTRLVTVQAALDPAEFDKMEPEVEAADNATYETAAELAATVPTTMAGLLALLDYIDRVNTGRLEGELLGATDDEEWPRIRFSDVEYCKGMKTQCGEFEMQFPFWVLRNIHEALDNIKAKA